MMAAFRGVAVGAFAIALFCATPALAQAPRQAPADGYQLHDESTMGPFTVQRWVSRATPEASPAVMCQCLTVVYDGGRRLLTLGTPGEFAAISVTRQTGQDVNGDGLPEVIVQEWSGGAHCCYSTTIYSVAAEVKEVLSINTGNCVAEEFEDLDGDGVLELTTCDDQWAYAYCSFAASPTPPVVYAYDTTSGQYVPSTPRFAARFRAAIAEDLARAREWMADEGGKDPGLDKCYALKPALALMYSGGFDQGVTLLRTLYRQPDRDTFERDVIERLRRSPMWVAP